MLFIKRHLTDTDKQLTRDFKEYPLSCFSDKQCRYSLFYTVFTSPLNRKVYDWVLLYRGAKSGELVEGPASEKAFSDLKQVFSNLKAQCRQPANTFLQTVSQYYRHAAEAESLSRRVGFYLTLPLMALSHILIVSVTLLFLLIFLCPLMLYKLAPSFFRKSMSSGSRECFLSAIPAEFASVYKSSS